jgi:hypothetical protein
VNDAALAGNDDERTMKMNHPDKNSAASRLWPLAAAVATLLAGCCHAPVRVLPPAPEALKAPTGESLFLEARATGVQVYACEATPAGTAPHGWVFKAPEATLASPWGQHLGKHFGGPTWEGLDGSTVVGEVKARDPGPAPSTAIPWLLLAAKSTTGSGSFSTTKSIQRLDTAGGLAPAEPCTEAQLGQAARVPYTATYFFYR